MGHHDKLKFIEVAAARAEVEAHIKECLFKSRVAEAVREYLEKGWPRPPKVVNATTAKKLAEHLQSESIPHSWVRYEKRDRWANEVRYYLEIGGLPTPEQRMSFEFPLDDKGNPDLVQAMQGNDKWGEISRRLGERMGPEFDEAAERFNNALRELKIACRYADWPGQPSPLHPLSSIFHWYALKD
jgi:hypothetical protein